MVGVTGSSPVLPTTLLCAKNLSVKIREVFSFVQGVASRLTCNC